MKELSLRFRCFFGRFRCRDFGATFHARLWSRYRGRGSDRYLFFRSFSNRYEDRSGGRQNFHVFRECDVANVDGLARLRKSREVDLERVGELRRERFDLDLLEGSDDGESRFLCGCDAYEVYRNFRLDFFVHTDPVEVNGGDGSGEVVVRNIRDDGRNFLSGIDYDRDNRVCACLTVDARELFGGYGDVPVLYAASVHFRGDETVPPECADPLSDRGSRGGVEFHGVTYNLQPTTNNMHKFSLLVVRS